MKPWPPAVVVQVHTRCSARSGNVGHSHLVRQTGVEPVRWVVTATDSDRWLSITGVGPNPERSAFGADHTVHPGSCRVVRPSYGGYDNLIVPRNRAPR